MKESYFNPGQPEYKELADLPEDQRANYVEVEGGGLIKKGFVEKSAADNDKKTAIAARFAKNSEEYILRGEADKFDKVRDRALKELDYALTSEKIKSPFTQVRNDVALPARNAVEFSPYRKELFDSEEVVRKYAGVIGAHLVFGEMSERLKNNKQFVLELLNTTGEGFKYVGGGISELPGNMSSDKDIIMAAMRTDPIAAFSHASETERNDLDFIATTLDVIDEQKYSPHTGFNALNEILRMADPALAKDILEKRELGNQK
ncbi:MAG: DUF4116 domain-containing protein [Candidatus Liptonbacteria bacterium]|nr:DUF4116 domain-containing protein [Candidatus Liptonbacteria bacterium]